MKFVIAGLVILLSACAAGAYEILLDLDNDDNPTTIVSMTFATSATVRIILSPSEPGEVVEEIRFGLGGLCRECEDVFEYGVSHDMFMKVPDWPSDPQWTGSSEHATCACCLGNPGFHDVYIAQPNSGSVVLDQAAFIAEFSAQITDPVAEGCVQPGARMTVFRLDGSIGSSIELGGPVIENDAGRWSAIKAMYR